MQKLSNPSGDLNTTNTTTPTVLVRDDTSTNPTPADFQALQRLRGQIEKHRKELKNKEVELAEADQTVQGVNTKHFL